MPKSVFEKVAQISIVVDDLYKYIKRYNDVYGIGPWVIMEFDKSNTSHMIVEGKECDFAIKLALCDSLNVQWELIQPLSDNGTYAEFLKKNGPGIHHICMVPSEDYETFRQFAADRGFRETLIGGIDSGGMEFSYVDLTDDIGCIVELINPPKDFVPPPPVDIYPKKEN